ncbi:unnamed protein product [Kuraishia capsulata CBS 1993]|uniref:Mitogen-activated protein kinase n=1 Tax=Kuraishia capsulata CBS 1993 TaxID=1382522 RepID=W6MWL0_9ASCO|nr:uncharacterized protein KUCA_T00003573001 [Kuraishia capsulata CBS 1993]CDK27595.1 unnamed protein product [Kuraishia capsulata CBS 1993]
MLSEENIVFNISADYRLVSLLGEGAYGVVALALHKPTGTKVAIKKINPFERPLFCLRTLREIKILKHFKHENVIQLHEVQKPADFASFQEVYLIQEYMETDLHKVLSSSSQISDDHCKYFTYQILKAVKALHSCDIIHRDLKPSNILLNSQCDLKVCDFGLARIHRGSLGKDEAAKESKFSFLTEYVATRWYRAPEIMLTSSQYSKAIDMWSIGCVLAEMLLGKPLFPGKDYRHQLVLIFEILGTPTGEDYYSVKSRRAREYLRTLKFYKKIPFERLFPRANPLAVDLIEKLLMFDQRKRITVEEALEHPYVSEYHNSEQEPSGDPIPKDFFYFDDHKEDFDILDLKRILYTEIMGRAA